PSASAIVSSWPVIDWNSPRYTAKSAVEGVVADAAVAATDAAVVAGTAVSVTLRRYPPRLSRAGRTLCARSERRPSAVRPRRDGRPRAPRPSGPSATQTPRDDHS